MASRDLVSNIQVARGISPGDYDTIGQPDPQVVDTQGFESCVLVFIAGAITTAQTLVLEHSVDGSAWDAVGGQHIIGGEAVRDAFLATGTTDNVIRQIGYIGSRRFVRVSCTSIDDGAFFALVGILGHPKYAPVDRS